MEEVMDRFVFDDKNEFAVNLGEIAKLSYFPEDDFPFMILFKSGKETVYSEAFGSKIVKELIKFNKELIKNGKALQRTES
jgi:hypothetical protein